MPNDREGLLEPGHELQGMAGVAYRIVEVIGQGRSGITYKGQVVHQGASIGETTTEEFVVIKTPRLKPQTINRLTAQLGHLFTKSQVELAAGSRLKDFEGAAQIVDVGLHSLRFHHAEIKICFIVQQFIRGELLKDHVAKCFCDSVDGTFKGATDAGEYLNIAAKITGTLEMIHQRGVVHGDIHEENIMVTENGTMVFIDFGEALLRDLSSPGTFGLVNSGMRIVPPEGSGTVAADVCSLGGLFYSLPLGGTLRGSSGTLMTTGTPSRKMCAGTAVSIAETRE